MCFRDVLISFSVLLEIPETINLKIGRVNLTHSFGGFSPWWVGPVAFGLLAARHDQEHVSWHSCLACDQEGKREPPNDRMISHEVLTF